MQKMVASVAVKCNLDQGYRWEMTIYSSTQAKSVLPSLTVKTLTCPTNLALASFLLPASSHLPVECQFMVKLRSSDPMRRESSRYLSVERVVASSLRTL